MMQIRGGRTMPKRVCILLILILISFLCACGKKTFRCAVCMQEVNQVPHEIIVLGEEHKICDSCYSYLK